MDNKKRIALLILLLFGFLWYRNKKKNGGIDDCVKRGDCGTTNGGGINGGTPLGWTCNAGSWRNKR